MFFFFFLFFSTIFFYFSSLLLFLSFTVSLSYFSVQSPVVCRHYGRQASIDSLAARTVRYFGRITSYGSDRFLIYQL